MYSSLAITPGLIRLVLLNISKVRSGSSRATTALSSPILYQGARVQLMAENRSSMERGMAPGSSGVPYNVYVFPVFDAPYVITVELSPSSRWITCLRTLS